MGARISRIALIGLSLLFAAGPSVAQDAIGSGNALDRNLGVGAGGVNPARITPDFRDRNLLITGDVAGGRGFRGAVGYTAPSDFRGRLGSNELFRFRADSAYSSPELFRLGNTFEQLRYGQDTGMIVEYRRAGSASPVSARVQNPVSVDFMSAGVPQRLDRTTLALSTELNLQQAAEPRVVGAAYGQEGRPFLFAVSPLRGLTMEPVDQNVGFVGLTSFDAARVRKDIDAGKPTPKLGAAYETRFTELKPGKGAEQPTVQTAVKPDAVDASIEPNYQEILQRIADRYAKMENVDLHVSPELLSHLQEEYRELRDRLTGTSREKAEEQSRAGEITPPSRSPDVKPRENAQVPSREAPIPPGDMAGGVKQTPPGVTSAPARMTDRDLQLPRRDEQGRPEPQSKPRPPLAIEEFGTLLRHGERIEKLSATDQDRFNEIMADAERKLRDGDYFLAERRFERALRFTPGHPMATVGAAHAQIGAGLHLSAAFSLRSLFTRNPEMIDVTYGPDLLPAKPRLDAALQRIDDEFHDPNVAPRDRANYAFLMAYIGHQTADRHLVDRGLDLMAQYDSNSELPGLLKSIWLGPRDENK
jgi:hypothetical protein